MSDTVSSDSVAQDQLRAFIERIERMEEEKKAIADDIREIYAEAKGNGFAVPVLREIIKIRKMDHAERMEKEALLDLYMAALGMQATPREDDDYEPRGRGVTPPDSRPAALQMRVEQVTGDVGNADDALKQGGAEVASGAHNPEVAGSIPAPATNSPETATRRVDDLGSVQDARKMSTDGHDLTTGHTPTEPLAPADDRQVPITDAPAGKPGGGTRPSPAPLIVSPKSVAHNDDPRCLDKAKCGEFSNFAFCMKCREAWRADHPIVEGVPA